MSFYKDYFKILNEAINSVNCTILDKVAKIVKQTANNGKKVIIVGNGGSAAMASHVSVDMTKSLKIRSINFNEADLLTCFSNDYGYEEWVSEALKSFADKGDLVILISSSGSSRNIINGALTAKKLELNLITLSGFNENNPLRQLGDINLYVNSRGYNIIEMTHHVWLVAIIDKIMGKIEY